MIMAPMFGKGEHLTSDRAGFRGWIDRSLRSLLPAIRQSLSDAARRVTGAVPAFPRCRGLEEEIPPRSDADEREERVGYNDQNDKALTSGGTMHRFSIRTLMAFVLVSAVGLAALKNASDLWAGMMLLVALGSVGIALLGAFILRGKERYWCAGFAFFAGGYVALAFAPWLSETFEVKMGTTYLLGELYSRVSPEMPGGNTIEQQQVSRLARDAKLEQFQRVGHSLFALLAGLLGGASATWFYARRKRTEAGVG